MTMRKTLLPLLLPLLVAACTGGSHDEPGGSVSPTAVGAEAGTEVLQPLTGSGLRFDGVYDFKDQGDIHYFMRFFERGNVALVAGKQSPGDATDISSYLTINAKSGTNSVHNVPVARRNDSLFFDTMAPRGAINYAGVVLGGDSVRFEKVSKVTGRRATVTYVFEPDSLKK